MDMSEKIKARRQELGLTLEKVGDYVGVGKSTVRKWEQGEIANMRRDKIARLAEVLKVTPAYLMGWKEHNNLLVPVLGEVAAGYPMYANEDIVDYEEISPEMAAQGEHFGLRIKGNSMEPRICDGDVVIVRKQTDVDTGDTAVVLVNGDSAAVKRIKKSSDGLMLCPTNPNYEPMFYNLDDIEKLPVQVIGRVVELRAKY